MNASQRTITIEVGGMTCASCVRSVERAAQGLPGVESITVNLATGDARVILHGEAGDDGASEPQEVIEAISGAGYRARLTDESVIDRGESAQEEVRLARIRFQQALLGTIPVAAAMWLLPAERTSLLIQGIGATGVLAFPGRHFFTTSLAALRRGHTTMDTLIALGAGTAYLASIATVAGALGESGMVFFETAAFLVTFISLGKWLEARARGEARSALRSLLDLAPPTARKVVDGEESEVPAADLAVGDRIVVLAGERIPADGVVRRGSGSVDESVITGEAIPVEKGAWDDVTGGTLNATGRLVIEVTATGGRTVLAGIVRMVREAQAHPAPIQRLADRVSGVFVPIVILLAGATFAFWSAGGATIGEALRHAVAVVVIACPCALGLATPTAILVGSGLGLRRGILIKNGEALEALARTDRIFLDKTGTLTEGVFTLDRIEVPSGAPGGASEEEILTHAAALERGSNHPLARAVVAEATARGLPTLSLDSVNEERGSGVRGSVGGREVIVGRRSFLAEAGIALGPEPADDGTSGIEVAIDGTHAGTLLWRDTPREEARQVVAALRAEGIEPILLTGDRRGAAERIAAEVGISTVEAEVRPGEKQERIRAAQEGGRVVAMVGDGINDAPALARADVGIAIGAGADAAKESGGIVLVRSELGDLLRAHRLARATLRKVRGNLVWAFLYNLLGLPVAAGAFAAQGLTLRPELAGLAMAMSSVSVVTNSLLLRRQEARIFR